MPNQGDKFMIKKLILPEISDSVDTAEVITVLVKKGDTVEIGQSIIEVVTDKAFFDVPSTENGMKIDDKDMKIMNHLLLDSRQSARQLSHRLGMSTVTMISRLKKLQENKIIQGYTVRLNHELLGYGITAII